MYNILEMEVNLKFLKNLLIVIFLFFMTAPFVYAKTAKVEALEDYNTKTDTPSTSFKLLDTIDVDDKIILYENTIFYADTYKIKDPKRLKQNAVFILKIKSFKDVTGNHTETDTLYAKYTTEINKAQLAKETALAAGNLIVKGFSIGYKTAEGFVQNKEGKHLKSGAIAAYKATPISYIEKGKDICIKKGDIFFLKFNYIDQNNHSLIDKFIYSVDDEED